MKEEKKEIYKNGQVKVTKQDDGDIVKLGTEEPEKEYRIDDLVEDSEEECQ